MVYGKYNLPLVGDMIWYDMICMYVHDIYIYICDIEWDTMGKMQWDSDTMGLSNFWWIQMKTDWFYHGVYLCSCRRYVWWINGHPGTLILFRWFLLSQIERGHFFVQNASVHLLSVEVAQCIYRSSTNGLPALIFVHCLPEVPSGKLPHNYGKSPFLMGKSIINGPCSIAMLNYQRVF